MTSPVFSQMTLLDIFVQALWSHWLANDVRDLFFSLLLQVIYEMTQGEKQLIEDLNLVKKVCLNTVAFV